ncbi:MAG: ATP-binding protein, partial [Candidatus Hodarchaeales archaeon]
MSDENADMTSELKSYEFQAETQRVLDILINKLYKNREIFLRELISNAADALHKLRIILYEKSEEVLNPEEDLGIRVKFDEDELTITVSDNGIGLTYDEAVKNLGTIAQSGTLEFLKQLENSNEMANLIGQFGVGFYSAFIVSKEVVVRSRSYHVDSKAIEWRSEGSGKFTVSYIDKESRGTDVILYLKEDAKEFADKYKLENIIKKYSDFVGFPIRIGDEDEIINRQIPIWHQSEEEVTDEEYNEFYRQVSLDWNKPFHRILINVDAPIQFRALLFL